MLRPSAPEAARRVRGPPVLLVLPGSRDGASGTVTLELALAQIPTVIAYKVTLFEELIARALVRVRMVGLANIILDEVIMPELLQRQATANNLAEALVAIIKDSPQRDASVKPLPPAMTRPRRKLQILDDTDDRTVLAVMPALSRVSASFSHRRTRPQVVWYDRNAASQFGLGATRLSGRSRS